MKFLLLLLNVSLASAFAGQRRNDARQGRSSVTGPAAAWGDRKQFTFHPVRSSNLLLRASSSSPEPEKGAGNGLVGTLARIDKSWHIQQRSRPQSRWKELSIASSSEQSDGSSGGSSSSSSTVYLLEPPSSTLPSSIVVFFGGAGLGQFPHIAYNELLLRVSNRLNAAVLAAPYSIALDHFDIAKRTGELARKALAQCEDQFQYPRTLPVYCVAHSLGCKLASIYMAATDQDYDGIAFLSYNNFGFGRTIGMAREFADAIGTSVSMMGPPASPMSYSSSSKTRDILNQVFDFAESAVSMIGIEFSPSPLEMNRLLQLKYSPERQRKTRLFSFDDDNLENADEFVRSCADGGPGPSVSGLPGTHLTPVFFKLELLDNVDDDLSSLIPEEAQEMVREAVGGYRSVSFGNEEQLDALVGALCGFILGDGPTRPAKWQRDQPLLAGSSLSSSKTTTNRTANADDS